MASHRDGTAIESLQSALTRTELIALGARAVTSENNEAGDLVEIYQIQKERGSIARAVMHGLLDLSTIFLWEFAATPIEHALDQQKFYSVKITFDADEQIQKIELY